MSIPELLAAEELEPECRNHNEKLQIQYVYFKDLTIYKK